MNSRVETLTFREPKYFQVKKYLFNLAAKKLKPGDKIPSENSLTKQFGVSKHTVRHGIKELVYEGYLRSEQGKGTFVASNRAGLEKAGNIGIIIGNVTNSIYANVLEDIQERLKTLDVDCLLSILSNDKSRIEKAIEWLRADKVEGAISGSIIPNRERKCIHKARKNRLPIVVIGSMQNLEIDNVSINRLRSMDLSIRHLKKYGCRRIAFVGTRETLTNSHFTGYKKALAKYNLLFDKSMVVNTSRDDNFADTVKIILGGKNIPDGIVATDDLIAIRVSSIIKQEGYKVPEDIKVVGFDDIPQASVCEIPLTTIAMPIEEIGKRAIDILFRRMKGNFKGYPAQIRVTPKLIIRESTCSRV